MNKYEIPDEIKDILVKHVPEINRVVSELSAAITTDGEIDGGTITQLILDLNPVVECLEKAVRIDEAIHSAAIDTINQKNASLAQALATVQNKLVGDKEKEKEDEVVDVQDVINDTIANINAQMLGGN